MLSFTFILGIAFLSRLACAGLTNYTIDDGASAVIYSETPIFQCTRGTCPEPWTTPLFNGTSTSTEGPIIVAFTGNAVYVYLAIVGACMFNLDGAYVGVFNNTAPTGNVAVQMAYHNTSIPDGPHILLISPAQADMLIDFDYVIYTAATKNFPKAHVGAIVGGVVGAVALVSGLAVIAFFWRRRDRQRKLFLRGVPLGDGDKASIKMVPMPTEK
ncbi:hypothetical protein DFH09DRAFT_450572 [Mycena vulgaris]|nr:hypothetical protein DFH09DRAFT_450572 [Mycena vulgaris]